MGVSDRYSADRAGRPLLGSVLIQVLASVCVSEPVLALASVCMSDPVLALASVSMSELVSASLSMSGLM